MKYLIPKQFKENGIENNEFEISQCALMEIIQRYTREAGVRHLERAISKVCRKIVRKVLQKTPKKKIKVTKKNLLTYLGVYKYKHRSVEVDNQVGQVNGLAWTQVGGEILTIESAIVSGKGKLIHTGQLGSVMTESIHAAMTVARSRSSSLKLDKDFHKKFDLHVHVPEGATPKDGPSAGVGMCTAIISALTNIPIRSDIAMTGEITLRGEVLAIGGLKEKLLAAHRGGIKTVLIPLENEKDLKEIPNNIKDKLDILPVKWIDEVLKESLIHYPISLTENKEGNEVKPAIKNIKNTNDSIRPH